MRSAHGYVSYLGIYTVLYCCTMYLYSMIHSLSVLLLCTGHTLILSSSVSRNKPNQRTVVSMITVLYVLNLTYIIIQWQLLGQWTVINGATRKATFLNTIDGPSPSLFAFCNFIFYLGFVVSDALLVSYCFSINMTSCSRFEMVSKDLAVLPCLGHVTPCHCCPIRHVCRGVR